MKLQEAVKLIMSYFGRAKVLEVIKHVIRRGESTSGLKMLFYASTSEELYDHEGETLR